MVILFKAFYSIICKKRIKKTLHLFLFDVKYLRNSSLEGGLVMPKIVVREKESIDDALRRFKRDVSRSGNLQEAKKRQYYLKPSDQRKQKRQEARKKYK